MKDLDQHDIITEPVYQIIAKLLQLDSNPEPLSS